MFTRQGKEEHFKSYEIEKRSQNKFNHFVMLEPIENSVRREINQMRDISDKLEYETLYKLYRLQNYRPDIQYFKGTSLKEGTLNFYRNVIKEYTLHTVVETTLDTTHRLIHQFITRIKKIVDPIPELRPEGLRPRQNSTIKFLLEHETTTPELKDFIKSEVIMTKKTPIKRRKHSKYPKEVMRAAYKTIAENYDKLTNKELAEKLRTEHSVYYAEKHVEQLRGWCRSFGKGKHAVDIAHCPPSLEQIWIDVKGNQLAERIGQKPVAVTNDIKKDSNFNEKANIAYDIMLDYFDSPCNTIYAKIIEKVGNIYSITTIRRYIQRLKRIKNGMNPNDSRVMVPVALLDKFVKVKKIKLVEQVKRFSRVVNTKAVKPVAKVSNKKQVESKEEIACYAILDGTGNIIYQTSSIEALKGYIACYNRLSSDSYRTVKLVDFELPPQ